MSIEWPLVFFTLFIGLGCGTFAGAVVMTEWYGKAKNIRYLSAIGSLVALCVGGFASVLHLGHIERIFGALGHPTSGIFMESTIIGLVSLDIVIYLLALHRGASDRTRRVIAGIGAVFAAILAFAVGDSYVMASRPAWDTLILPTCYLVQAGVMGCFSLKVLIYFESSPDVFQGGKFSLKNLIARGKTPDPVLTKALNRATLVAVAILAVLLAAYVVHLSAAPYPDTTRSAARVFSGNLAPLFWGGLVALGVLAPAGLALQKPQCLSPVTRATLGLGCVLVGGVVFRVLMFVLGSSIKQYFPNF